MRALIVSVALCGLAAAATIPTGPNVGETVPDFRLEDQNRRTQTLRSILRPKGALVFYRSADW